MERSFHQGAKLSFTKLAKKLRLESTLAEKLLWSRIKARRLNGWKFRRQHPFGSFILDFYCHEKKLVIELDGGYHDYYLSREQDKERDKILKKHNIKVLRFKNDEVLHGLEAVLQTIATTTISNP